MSTVATAPLLWCSSTSRRSVSVRSSGVSPGSTSTVPSTSGAASSATRVACPVPRCSACTTGTASRRDLREVGGDRLPAGADDDQRGVRARAARPRRACDRPACARPSRAAPWDGSSACGCPPPPRARRPRSGGRPSLQAPRVRRHRFPASLAGRPARPPAATEATQGWGTRTRTETARLQRPAGCRLPHPPRSWIEPSPGADRDRHRPGARKSKVTDP